MEDPAYTNGVKSESVIDTFHSVMDAFKGKTPFIVVPVPIDRPAPVTHISFCTTAESKPNSAYDSTQHVSRRTYACILNNRSYYPAPVVESQSASSTRDIESISEDDDIMSTITDLVSRSIIDVQDNADQDAESISTVSELPHAEEPVEHIPVPSLVSRRRRRATERSTVF